MPDVTNTQDRREVAPLPKQTQAPVPGIPGLSTLTYASGNSSWRSDFTDPQTGKPTCQILGRRRDMTLADAVAAHVALKTLVAEGRSPCSGKMILNASFYNHVLPAAEKRSKKSVRDDGYRYAKHLSGLIGHLPIGKLTPRLLQPIAQQLRATLKPALAEKVIALIRAICRDLVALGLLETNPALALKLRQVDNAKHRVLSDDEGLRLGRAFENASPLLRRFVPLLALTGLRVGELRKARFSDVDETNSTLSVRGTKNGKDRAAPLSTHALPLIAELKAVSSSDWLFPSARGDGPMAYPRKAFMRVLQEAGISDFTMHCLRRSHGSAAIEDPSVNVYECSKLLGHSSVRVTERHYLVAQDKRVRNASNVASSAMYERLGLGRRALPFLEPSCHSVVIERRFTFVFGGPPGSIRQRPDISAVRLLERPALDQLQQPEAVARPAVRTEERTPPFPVVEAEAVAPLASGARHMLAGEQVALDTELHQQPRPTPKGKLSRVHGRPPCAWRSQWRAT